MTPGAQAARPPLQFRSDSLALLFLTAGLLASVFYVFTDDNAYFRPAQLFFAAVIVFMLACTDLAAVLFRGLIGNWGGRCLLALDADQRCLVLLV